MTGSFLSNGTSKERDIHCSIGKDNFVDFTVKVICVASLYKNTLFLYTVHIVDCTYSRTGAVIVCNRGTCPICISTICVLVLVR